MEELRKIIKGRGLTQAALARRLKVSVPTIKRWLRGEGLDLNTLDRLLSELGVTLVEVASLAGTGPAKSFEYTDAQEQFLSRDLQALAVFDHLLIGISIDTIESLMKLSKDRILRILKELEVVGLLERHPGGRVKLLVQGEPVWRKGGPLAKTFKDSAIHQFLGHADRIDGAKRMGIYWLRREDMRRAQVLLDDLRDFLGRAESQAKRTPERARMYGCLTALAHFDWYDLAKIQPLKN